VPVCVALTLYAPTHARADGRALSLPTDRDLPPTIDKDLLARARAEKASGAVMIVTGAGLVGGAVALVIPVLIGWLPCTWRCRNGLPAQGWATLGLTLVGNGLMAGGVALSIAGFMNAKKARTLNAEATGAPSLEEPLGGGAALRLTVTF